MKNKWFSMDLINHQGGAVSRAKTAGISRPLLISALVSLLGVTACSNNARVQVVDRQHAVPTVTSGQYRVQRGDTLYSIATRHGWNWKALASLNGIAAPYNINPGQVIRFSGQAQPVTPVRRPATVVTTPAKTTPAKTAPQTTVSRPVVSQPTTTTKPTPAPSSSASVSTAAVSSKGWRWPASGQVVGRFSGANKGIDIAGNAGDPIVSASDGTVVYAGSGLVGYGELIIIKHSDVYLSAYGHNRRILVNEGQKVKSGQKIAEMGSTGTDTTKLHFEIRRQGKSVDPIPYLPTR